MVIYSITSRAAEGPPPEKTIFLVVLPATPSPRYFAKVLSPKSVVLPAEAIVTYSIVFIAVVSADPVAPK